MIGLGGTSVALAQEGLTLERAEGLIEDAEFDTARGVLHAIAEGGGLSRPEVLRWLELQALLEFAVGREQPLRSALAGIASLDPTYALSSSRPPELSATLTEMSRASHGTISQRVDTQITGVGVVLRAAVENDPASLVRESRIFGRAEGESEWRVSSNGELVIHAEDAAIAYYAVAIGPGGAILAREGSESAPVTLAHPRLGPAADLVPAEDMTALWAGLGVGIGIVIATAVGITLGIVLTPEQNSALGRPLFDFELTPP